MSTGSPTSPSLRSRSHDAPTRSLNFFRPRWEPVCRLYKTPLDYSLNGKFIEFPLPPIEEFILLTIYLGVKIAAILVKRQIQPLVFSGESYVVAPRRSKVQLTLLLFALNWSMEAVYGIPTSTVISIRLRWFNAERPDLCSVIIPVLVMLC